MREDAFDLGVYIVAKRLVQLDRCIFGVSILTCQACYWEISHVAINYVVICSTLLWRDDSGLAILKSEMDDSCCQETLPSVPRRSAIESCHRISNRALTLFPSAARCSRWKLRAAWRVSLLLSALFHRGCVLTRASLAGVRGERGRPAQHLGGILLTNASRGGHTRLFFQLEGRQDAHARW